jgi:hypothetical protein
MSSVTRQMRFRVITVCVKRCRIEQDHNEWVQYSLQSVGFPDKLELTRCDVTRSLYILNGYFCVSDLGESCKLENYAIQIVCKSPYVCKEDVCSKWDQERLSNAVLMYFLRLSKINIFQSCIFLELLPTEPKVMSQNLMCSGNPKVTLSFSASTTYSYLHSFR